MATNNFQQYQPNNQYYNSSQQNYIKYLQSEIQRLQDQQASNQIAQPQQADLSLPVRHADILQVKSKDMAKKEHVDNGCSKMFMNESEDEIYVKSIDENGTSILYTYLRQEPENITSESEFVTKADMKSFLNEAVEKFSGLVPKEDQFVRKDEIRDIIVETLSSGRKKREEE